MEILIIWLVQNNCFSMTKIFRLLLAFSICFGGQPALAEEDIASAESSFRYLATTLHTFRTTGRFVNNPGIDGSELEIYIALLATYYEAFSRNFDRDSALCRFYMDPENGRMTIEDRAELSFSLLPDVDDRNARYLTLDREFQESIEEEFGSLLLTRIVLAKADVVSNQRLPTSEFDEADRINFIDNACI